MTRLLEGSEFSLVLAPAGRDAAVICSSLQSAGLVTCAVSQLDDLLPRLGEADTAVIAEEALSDGERVRLATWVTQQPAWSDFPFILLTQRGEASSARLSTLVESLGNVTLIERPLRPMIVASAARSAMRARRRQRLSRAYWQQREDAEVALRELAVSLEERVRERTQQLSGANDRLTAEIAERERTESVLLHAQKMEAIGQLTGGIAHDFNNLLTAIVGNLDLLSHRLTDERILRLIRNAMHAAERGSKLTEQLLAFSRRQRLAPTPIDVNALVSGMGDLLSRTLGGTIRIETLLERGLWTAMVDSNQLELALLNLAINARDAMPTGGRLTIETANVAGIPAELSAEIPAGEYVMIAVHDNGTGMGPEVLTRAFEPFFTTKQQGKGSGLGLSQVYGFAKQSGGTVRIESRFGKGTKVCILLPRTEAAVVPLHPEDLPRVLAADDETILVVDDDDDVRELVVGMLQELSYRVLSADNGKAAVEIIESGAPIDLVLLDVAMPGMTGVEVARAARQRRPLLKILFASGYTDINTFGADLSQEDLIRKPYRMVELSSRVQQALQKAPAEAGEPPSNVVDFRPR